MIIEKSPLAWGLWRIQQLLTNLHLTSNKQPSKRVDHDLVNQEFERRRARSKNGEVYLIGAGPGDAELLTLKAYRLIQQTDVVMFDWLVNPDIIKMIPDHVERIFVGKKCGQHSMQQADICQLMVEVAQSGKNIVRLKGGDPAIFARAAEECDILAQHQIDFAIVPGITAASGASAYAGIPLTHRECAQSVRFITAHLKSARDEPNWRALVAGASACHGETLVFYMGLKRIDTIMQRLQKHGLSSNTAVAVIDQATTTQQQVCVGTLENIAQRVRTENFQGPAITIVGEVVNKRHQVNLSLLSNTTVPLHAKA
ncbi:MAG: uroporphyrinogen-III C-methyltransferase [Paraglaciecola sp.]|uniref:uroporphyrinogen-III C-methyltransferase n=1 Tax=Paraglaciecola sp. TaxID=1920173 RepID=UPI003298EF20